MPVGAPRTAAGSPGGPGRGTGWDGRDPGGIDPRDPRWNGRDSGAPTRRMPGQPDPNPASRPGRTPPGGVRPAISQPGRLPLGAGPLGAGPRGTQEARRVQASGGRGNPRPGRRGQFGSLQGGLGVCLIVASTAIGAIATIATGRAPGFTLGVFVVIGTLVAALAVRPRAGRLIFPVPVLAYLVAALISGIIYNRSDDSSKTAVAIGAAQWIANGFVAMAFATVAAIVLITVRWCFWRRGRKTGPARPGPGRRPQPDQATAVDPRYPADYPDSRYPADYPGSGYPADYRGSGYPADYRDQGRRPDGAGAGNWGDERPPAPDYGRPRPGSGPYNFSSGA